MTRDNIGEVQGKSIDTLREVLRGVIQIYCIHNAEITGLELCATLQELAEDVFVGAEG